MKRQRLSLKVKKGDKNSKKVKHQSDEVVSLPKQQKITKSKDFEVDTNPLGSGKTTSGKCQSDNKSTLQSSLVQRKEEHREDVFDIYLEENSDLSSIRSALLCGVNKKCWKYLSPLPPPGTEIGDELQENTTINSFTKYHDNIMMPEVKPVGYNYQTKDSIDIAASQKDHGTWTLTDYTALPSPCLACLRRHKSDKFEVKSALPLVSKRKDKFTKSDKSIDDVMTLDKSTTEKHVSSSSFNQSFQKSYSKNKTDPQKNENKLNVINRKQHTTIIDVNQSVTKGEGEKKDKKEQKKRKNLFMNKIKQPPHMENAENCPKLKEKVSESREAKSSGGTAGRLQCCPLCQTEFSTSLQQLEIDSHLAECLSKADGDVDW